MKKNYFLMMLMVFASLGSFAQTGDGHNPNGTLSYNPAGYSVNASMIQDSGYLNLVKNTINNNGGNTDLFVNFTFDTSGKNVFIIYTTDNSNPSKSNGNVVNCTFSNYSEPNRTFIGSIPNTVNVAGESVNYIFYISDSDLASAWGRVQPSGLVTSWTEGDIAGFNYSVFDSNIAAGGNWSDTTTWNSGSVPNSVSSSVEIIGTNSVTLNQNIDVLNLKLLPSSILNLSSSNGLGISGNLLNSGTVTANHGSSIKVEGTSTGSIVYNVAVSDMNWHLLSSPVEGEGYDTSWVDDNLIDNTTRTVGTNVGISTYDNTTGNWVYATDGSTGNFDTGKGYSIKRDATGSDISFTGTIKIDDASIPITASDIGGGSENRWSLIGNPFTNYVNVADLLALTANDTALEDSREALYVWNGTTYAPLTTGFIYPGQGFFVNSNVASTSIAINQNMLAHQNSGVTFYKNQNNDFSISLIMTNDKNTSSTKINYVDGKTKGLDPKFDLGTFTGVSNPFSIYSHLLSDDRGIDFMHQALPNSDLESMVIPVGIIADANKEITFSANVANLPSGIKVFLEDRTTNTFTRLDELNSTYKVTLNEKTNDIGRFYLHTKSAALSTETVALENVSIYSADQSTLRIVGLSQGKSTIKMFNVLGKQVLNSTFNSNGVSEINVSQLSTGVYIVQLANEAGTLNKKIVLE